MTPLEKALESNQWKHRKNMISTSHLLLIEAGRIDEAYTAYCEHAKARQNPVQKADWLLDMLTCYRYITHERLYVSKRCSLETEKCNTGR